MNMTNALSTLLVAKETPSKKITCIVSNEDTYVPQCTVIPADLASPPKCYFAQCTGGKCIEKILSHNLYSTSVKAIKACEEYKHFNNNLFFSCINPTCINDKQKNKVVLILVL